jgi:IS1 family transposase
VGKKEKHVDPADPQAPEQGDQWDHVALDPEHRLVLSVVVGKRTAEHTQLLLQDLRSRTGDRAPEVMTSDENPAYAGAIVAVYGVEVTPPRTGQPGRPRASYRVPPAGVHYATVHKRREKNRLVEVSTRMVFGTAAGLRRVLAGSAARPSINTAYVERQHATDRHRNARKGRRTYRFSKDWGVHQAMTRFTLYSYNFCWPVRTLRQQAEDGHWQPRTPAMAAGLADHVWSLDDWLSFPGAQHS